jgi:hypothetical protein
MPRRETPAIEQRAQCIPRALERSTGNIERTRQRPHKRTQLGLLALGLAACLAAGDLEAAKGSSDKRLPFKPSTEELMQLPDFCQAKLAGDKEVQREWARRMGKDIYMHLHHYCHGLVHVSRAQLAFGSKHKRHYQQTAIAQFNYVLRNWPADFELTADAKLQKDRLEFQLNKP